ncbi:hypothetical protein ACHAXS_012203 [Conticribra weissflogii]
MNPRLFLKTSASPHSGPQSRHEPRIPFVPVPPEKIHQNNTPFKMHKLSSLFLFFVAAVQLASASDIPIQSTKSSYASTGVTRLNHDIHVTINNYHTIASVPNKDPDGKVQNVFEKIGTEKNLQQNEALGEKKGQQFPRRDLQRQTDDDYYQPKPYYGQQSKFSKWQKIILGVIVTITALLTIYTCVLHYELSTLNVYSLLGMGNNTEEEDEEKVGDAYMRNDGVELS